MSNASGEKFQFTKNWLSVFATTNNAAMYKCHTWVLPTGLASCLCDNIHCHETILSELPYFLSRYVIWWNTCWIGSIQMNEKPIIWSVQSSKSGSLSISYTRSNLQMAVNLEKSPCSLQLHSTCSIKALKTNRLKEAIQEFLTRTMLPCVGKHLELLMNPLIVCLIHPIW